MKWQSSSTCLFKDFHRIGHRIARVIYVTLSKDANHKIEDALVCIVAQALSVRSIANLKTGVL